MFLLMPRPSGVTRVSASHAIPIRHQASTGGSTGFARDAGAGCKATGV